MTFIVIPGNDGPVHEYLCSPVVLWGAAVLVVVLLGALLSLGVGFCRRVDQGQVVVQLAAENSDLLRSLELTRRDVAQLEGTMEVLATDDERLRAYHMMEPLSGEERLGGVGGAEDLPEDYTALPAHKRSLIEDLHSRIHRLQQEAGIQASSFAAIRQRYLERRGDLRYFPTICPVPRDRTWVSSRFGYRSDPFTGKQAFHSGVDFAGRTGTPVQATADGMVTYAYRDIRLGNAVVVEHDIRETTEDGQAYERKGIYRTEYGHLERITVSRGQRVQRGDTIGYLGNTGRSTGPHLHYAVRFQDSRRGAHRGYVNAEEFLLDAIPPELGVASRWQTEEEAAEQVGAESGQVARRSAKGEGENLTGD